MRRGRNIIMRHWLVRGPLLGLLVIGFLFHAQSAGALLEWCRTDPVVDIGGKRMHVYVSGPGDLLEAVTGPTVVEISVPIGVPVSLISTDPGFGLGWDVRFAESEKLRVTDRGIEVSVRTYVPANATFDVLTEVTNGSDVVLVNVLGTTNTWDRAKAWL